MEHIEWHHIKIRQEVYCTYSTVSCDLYEWDGQYSTPERIRDIVDHLLRCQCGLWYGWLWMQITLHLCLLNNMFGDSQQPVFFLLSS